MTRATPWEHLGKDFQRRYASGLRSNDIVDDSFWKSASKGDGKSKGKFVANGDG